MKIKIALYDAWPWQMDLYKQAHPKCHHIPLFKCGDEVWPLPVEPWVVERTEAGTFAVCEVPE